MPLPFAHWHAKLALIQPPLELRDWLSLSSSLTARLQRSCAIFSIRRLLQQRAAASTDEACVLGLTGSRQIHERDVLLCCDGMPVVFAHTCLSHSLTRADWPGFDRLGERSLGSLLFNDPQVKRCALQFACLPSQHPLMQRICSAIPAEQIKSRLFARRCLFQRNRSKMLVTEIFLPGIINLNCLK